MVSGVVMTTAVAAVAIVEGMVVGVFATSILVFVSARCQPPNRCCEERIAGVLELNDAARPWSMMLMSRVGGPLIVGFFYQGPAICRDNIHPR